MHRHDNGGGKSSKAVQGVHHADIFGALTLCIIFNVGRHSHFGASLF
jgi:hypothetical protein